MTRVPGYLLGLLAAAAMLWLACVPAQDEVLAEHLLILHGHLDAPKIVHRTEENLRVVTATGHFEFVQQPPCDERLPCALGLRLLCWDAR